MGQAQACGPDALPFCCLGETHSRATTTECVECVMHLKVQQQLERSSPVITAQGIGDYNNRIRD